MKQLLVGVLAGACVACGSDTPAPDRGVSKPDLGALPDLRSKGCSQADCPGCCWDGECMSGFDPLACGQGGMLCMTCGPGATCPAGTCVEPQCDTTTCKDGCCDTAGKCRQGISPADCGTGGESCVGCTDDQGCVEKKCVDKGPPMHKTTLVSSKISGSSLSVCGLVEFSSCDLYVILKVGNAVATSKIAPNSNEPQWDEYMLTAIDSDLMSSFDVEVRDDDPWGSSGVGKCKPEITEAVLTSGELVTDCGDAKDLTFSFQPI